MRRRFPWRKKVLGGLSGFIHHRVDRFVFDCVGYYDEPAVTRRGGPRWRGI